MVRKLYEMAWFHQIVSEMTTIQQAWKLRHLILGADCYQRLAAIMGNKIALRVLIETG